MRFSARSFLILFLALACPAQLRSPENASTAGNVYTNFFFQFRYTFSASWVEQKADAAEQFKKTHLICVANDNNAKSYDLLTLFRTLPGEGLGGKSRAVISLVAEDVSSSPQITNGKDCVLRFVEHEKGPHLTPIGAPLEMQVSGHTFFRQDLKGTAAGVPVYESAIFTLTRNYAVGFLLISPNQLMLNNMIGTLEKMEFY